MKSAALLPELAVVQEDQTSVPAGVAKPLSGQVRLLVGPRWLYAIALAATAGLFLPPLQRLFAAAGWRWLHVLLVSFGVSWCLNPVCARLALRLGIVDRPGGRKPHRRPTPLLGGAAVFTGFFAALLANWMFSRQLAGVILGALVLIIVGIADDWKELPAAAKLGAQVFCVLLVMACGIQLRILPGRLGIFAAAGNGLLTLLWIVGITNAMNFFDGMDGLAAGLGMLVAFFLGAIAFQTQRPFVGWIAVAVVGACLGFLPYNFRIRQAAAVFLGDAGSTVIGFILACLAVYGDWAEGNPVAAIVCPLLIFWIFIFDMVHITVERIASGKVLNFRQWIEYVGRDHLHHRLERVLGGKRRSVLFIFLLTLCLGASAFVLRNAGPLDAVLLILQAVIIVALITILEHRGRCVNGEANERRG